MNEEELEYILECLRFKTSIYRDKSKRNLPFNDDDYYSNILYQYITKIQNNWNELKKFIKEVYDEENKYNFGTEDYAYNQVLCYMQELEQGKDE